jgi:hypothetical protein
MREVQVEFMGRHIRAFRQETHVTQRARVDHRFKVSTIDGVQLAAFTIIDQVEQAWETITKVKTAPTAMAYIKNPAQLFVQCLSIIKRFVLPIQWVSDRGV